MKRCGVMRGVSFLSWQGIVSRPGTVLSAPNWTIVCLLAAGAVIAPFAAWPGPRWAGITAFLCAFMFVSELATSLLLYIRAAGTRRPSLAMMATAYLYSALMALLYLATFPDAMRQGGQLLGGDQAAAWTFVAWLAGWSLLAAAATLIEMNRSRTAAWWRPSFGAVAAASAFGAVALLALLLTGDDLPTIVVEGRWNGVYLAIFFGLTIAMAAVVALIVVGLRGRSSVFAWLAVALAAMAIGNALAGLGGERYAFGWLLARVGYLGAAGILFGFFLFLFSKQQKALSDAKAELERRVRARTAELSAALAERDLLLREVHHRVKNNLQLIDSLLHFQTRRLADGESRAILQDVRQRVRALGLVHQQLVHEQREGRLRIRPLIEELTDNLARSLGAAQRGMTITTRSDDLEVDMEMAAPIGLIVTELVTNAAKHAFEEGQSEKRVEVAVRRQEGDLALEVRDNGARRPDPNFIQSSGTGVQIVRALVAQLGGVIDAAHRHGTIVRVRAPLRAPA